jgi:uncharacterized protein (DUF885 family)
MRSSRNVTGLILTALFFLPSALPYGADTSGPDTRRAQFKQLLADEWEYELNESPETATIIGDYRYNDRWSDYSLAHPQVQKQDAEKWLSRFEAVDDTGFPEQDKLSRALMLRNLKQRIEGVDLKTYEMPVDQFNGVHLQLAQLVEIAPFSSTKQYEDYLARLHQIPTVIEQVIGVLRQGERDRLLPPRFLLEKTVNQCKSIADALGEANVFGQPVSHFPEVIPAADRKRLHDAVITAVDSEVRPAYSKLANFIASDYAPKGRSQPGLWALPNGDALYRFDIRQQTTTEMDPEAIHQLGLQEVARIEGEQFTIAKQLGFSDLESFRASFKTNAKLFPATKQQIVDDYRSYIGQMRPQLPKLFGLLPQTQLDIRPMQAYREKESAAADYSQGTPDGSRPGVVYVNTGDYQHRLLLQVESTAYHEGVPGHHMQISIAQTLPDLPAFRQQASYTAYIEGWALYAERLGKDIGFYQDPYSDYGRLSGEMLRAIRLVVDTGVHSKHWTRQQMVDFFHQHSDEDEPNVQAETDRYIAFPAQALAYKLGQLEILKLRQRTQSELGSKYDIRAFHDEILNGGALPLDVLDQRVTAWIAAQKSGKPAAGD